MSKSFIMNEGETYLLTKSQDIILYYKQSLTTRIVFYKGLDREMI